ncbi:hypothetical protein RHECNPAF_850069 [Rhizobium etli CNPAF512]|nr:hypothetical protein RHECNPAF_850069 [Rhizobium etli CNPAF512]
MALTRNSRAINHEDADRRNRKSPVKLPG